MPFIGKSPQVGAFQLIDSITTSATDTYALTVSGSAYVPESARNLIVSLNGVTQAPETAYTVSGSNIVFASALTASDVIDYILVIGDAVDIGTPSDNTVGDAQLKAALDLSSKTLTFANDQISGDVINGGTISSFASTGIDDNATSTALTVTDSGIAATLTTAAQPNITSVGTLTGFTSTGIDDNATSTAITIDSSENVGIGTTSPGRLLHLESATPAIRIKDTSGTGTIHELITSGTNGNLLNLLLDAGGAGTSPAFIIKNVGTELMRIASSGNVGIGTSSPSNTLTVNKDTGSTPTVYINNSGSDATDGPALKVQASGRGTGIADVSVFSVHNISDEIFTVRNDGNVGIGTTSPSTKLHLGGTAPLDSIIRQDSTVSGTNWEIGERAAGKWQIWEDDSDSVVATFTSSGLLGIGTTSPIGPLSVVAASGGGAIDVFGRSADGLGWLTYKTNNGASSHAFIGTPIADTLAFYTNGFNERMRIDSSGNVGIGTTNPSALLTLEDSNAELRFVDSSRTSKMFTQNGGRDLQIQANQDLIINASGGTNVGIGTSSPLYELSQHVSDSGANYHQFTNTATGTTSTSGFLVGIGGDEEATLWNYSNTHMRFATNSTERMRIDSSGNVGINTTSPDALVTLNPPNYTSSATGGMIKWKNTNNSGHSNIQSYFVSGQGTDLNIGANAYINTSGAWARWSSGLATSAISCARSGNINFITNTSSGDGLTRMTIDSSGNLLVGKTSTDYGTSTRKEFNLYGTNEAIITLDTGNASPFYLNNNNGGADIWNQNNNYMRFGTNSTERMRIDSSGQILMGTSSVLSGGVDGLHLNTSADTGITFGYGGTVKGWLYFIVNAAMQLQTPTGITIRMRSGGTAGVELTNGGTSWNSLSDEHKKDIIEPITNASEKVSTLRAVIGKFKEEDEGIRRSFLIAQDVQKVLPEAVEENDEGDLLLSYTETIPLLVAAIKEQQEQLNQFKTELAALKGA
jgi:hypothetical protein